MRQLKKLFGSKTAVLGFFAVLTLLLAIPLIVMMMQEEQDPRQFADEITTEKNQSK